jgi:hypothetical protein
LSGKRLRRAAGGPAADLGGTKVKVKYCKKYEKYVSEQHCEFFNDGRFCEFYSATSWPSIKELLRDTDRPKWEANAIIKPFKCSLMSRENTHQRNRARRRANA